MCARCQAGVRAARLCCRLCRHRPVDVFCVPRPPTNPPTLACVPCSRVRTAVTVLAKEFIVSDGTKDGTKSFSDMAKDIEILAGTTQQTVDALVLNVTALDERSRRTQAEIGGSLKAQVSPPTRPPPPSLPPA